MKDSDCDGISNGDELGDPDCKWEPGQTPTRTTGITHPGYASVEVSAGVLNDDCSNYTKNVKELHDLGANVSFVPLIYEQGINVPAKQTSYFNWIFQAPVTEDMMALRSHCASNLISSQLLLR